MSPDYYTEIEAHFAHRRGTPFILNAKDWVLMKSWSDGGIPLSVVIEAIDSVFDRNEEKGNRKVINSLSYCRHAVKEIWKDRQELLVGEGSEVPEASVEQRLDALAIGVERAAPDFAPRIRELLKEKSVPRIEERLMELEEELMTSLVETSLEASALREEARMLTAGSDEKTRERAEAAHLRRLVRERFELPRLTLF